jgi:tRNA threonylcarbamoyladenosine biosynthesis protein TsaB
MSHLLLATDTSGKNGSIALARVMPGQSDIEIVEVVPLAGGAFSAQLVPQIAALLENHGYRKTDLAAFAVVSGPGSFTGLRVGLAAIKALAEALQKPIAAISLLEAVAWSGTAHGIAPGRILAALDAGRGDVYVGDYEFDPRVHMHSERLLSREEFMAEARGAEAPHKTVVTPNAVLAAMVQAAGTQVEPTEYPNAGVIARLGWERLQRGQTVRPEELEANYIRHSDAEIFSKPAS